MGKLYLVRHGETVFNRNKRIQGWTDSPLTELGISQAMKAGEYFKEHGITFDHAYSSTSERACDTLELIVDMPYTRLKGLKEMFYGTLDGEPSYLGAPNREIRHTYYKQFGGTTTKEVGERMMRTLTEIMSKEGHESVLVVSHGAASFNFLVEVLGYEPDMSNILGNCCCFSFEFKDGKFNYEQYLDTQK